MNQSCDAKSAVDFLSICGDLKTTKRTGWVNHEIQLPESISDHMHRMACASMLLDNTVVNRSKCIRMALVHDIGEAICGDFTPFDPVSKEQKHQLEKDALLQIRAVLGDHIAGDEIYDLWCEYETAETVEAQFVKDIDKFEMVLQAFEYEKAQNRDLSQFYNGLQSKIKSTCVSKWYDEVISRRERWLQSNKHIKERNTSRARSLTRKRQNRICHTDDKNISTDSQIKTPFSTSQSTTIYLHLFVIIAVVLCLLVIDKMLLADVRV